MRTPSRFLSYSDLEGLPKITMIRRKAIFKHVSRILSHCVIFLLLLITGLLSPSWTQEKAQEKKQESDKSKPAETPPPANKNQSDQKEQKDQEEYFEIKTPFGIQRVPKKSGAVPPQTASPLPAPAPPAPALPAASPANPVSAQPTGAAPTAPKAAEEQTPSTRETLTPEKKEEEPTKGGVRRVREGSGTIRLQLDRADLKQVINIIGTELKLNYIVDPKVTGMVTINTRGEVRREDLLPLLQTLLSLNGAAIVKTGNFYQIVPAAKAKQLPIQPQKREQAAEAPAKNDSLLMMQVIPMRFVSASDMSKILTPYLSDVANMVVHERGNILIIIEAEENMKRLLELVDIFDADVFKSQRIQLFPVKNNRSSNLVVDLQNIFAAYALSEKDSAIRFLSIDRINSILVISSNPNSYTEVEKWIAKLDRPPENAGIRNFVYKIENSEARRISNSASADLWAEDRKRETCTCPRADWRTFSTSFSTSGARVWSGSRFQTSAERTLAGYVQGEIKIVADEVNNALIIQCSPHDYELIKETIRSLDIVPRQVLIDAKIYEVNLTGALSMGVSAFLQQRSNASLQTGASFSTSRVGIFPAGLNVTSGMLIGSTRELLGFLNAQESRTRTRVLSAPSVIASDNVAAKIQVGSEVPMLTSQGVNPGVTQGGTSLYTNTISNRQTGIIMTVTPRINASGWVTLKINQEVSNPVARRSRQYHSIPINQYSFRRYSDYGEGWRDHCHGWNYFRKQTAHKKQSSSDRGYPRAGPFVWQYLANQYAE